MCSKKKIIGFKEKMLKTQTKNDYLLGLDALQVENQKYLIKTWDFCWYGVKKAISLAFKIKCVL